MASEQFLLGLAFVAVCILAVKSPRIFASKSPVKTARATVVCRKGELSAAALPAQWGGKPNYQVTFCVDGENMVLSADARQYTRLLEGTSGLLSWKDDTLVDFVPDSPESSL